MSQNLNSAAGFAPRNATQWPILNNASIALSKAKTASDILRIITQSLNRLGFDVLTGRIDSTQTTLTIQHVSLRSTSRPAFGHISLSTVAALNNRVVPLQDLSFYEAVFGRGEAILLPLARKDVLQLVSPVAGQDKDLADQKNVAPCTCIIAPLKAKGTVTHLLVATSTNIHPDDMPVINAFATFGSAIMENLVLVQQAKEQQRIAETLQNVSKIVSSSLDLDIVLNLILEQLSQVVQYDSASILLERNNTLKLEAGSGFTKKEAVLNVVVPVETNTLYQEMKRYHKPIVINDVRKDPRYAFWAGTSPIRSWIGTPLIWQDKTIGQISIDSFAVNAFSEKEGQLAFTFAQHVSTAINNARLFRQTTKTADELRALLNSARDVASTLDTQKVINAMATRVKDLMQARLTAVHLITRDKQTLDTIVCLDDTDNPQCSNEAKAVATQAIAAKQGIIRNPQYQNNVPPPTAPPLPGAFMSVPFVIKDKVIGAITMCRGGDSAFKSADLDLLTRFALQTGIAIENSRLYQQVERRLKREALLNRLARRLSSKLSLDALATDIMQTASAIAEADAATLTLVNPANGESFLQYWHNFPTDDLPPVLKTTPGIVYKVLEEQKVLVTDNLAVENYNTPPWLPIGVTGAIAVPITSGNEPLGVLGLFSFNLPIEHSIEVLNTIEAIGRQTGVAVENALLFQQVNDYARNLAAQVEARTAEIRSQKEQTDAILASAADAIIITNADGTIEYVNPAFTTLTGYYPEEVIGKNPRILNTKQTPPHVYAHMWKTLLEGKIWRGELKDKRKDDTQYDADLTIAPIFNHHGQIDKFVGIQRDISKLRELDRLKTEFLGTAAHELRSPLTTIRGYAELLMARTDFSREEIKKFVGYIHEQSVHLSNLVSDLLDVSKIESGAAFSISPRLMNPRQLFEKQIALWQSRTTNHNIQLIEPDYWPELKIDESRLEQALNNLLSNAIKYSPDGGSITVTVTRSTANLRVSVQDNGIGMSLVEQAHVFEKFWRADASSTAIEGTGLGMVIVKHIIESHGGKIWVSSQKSQGTTISFTLPLVIGVANILIIEDEPSILEVEERILRTDGYEVITAQDGASGLERARNEHPDLIVLDLMLPKMNGEAVLQHLKSTPATQHIPVVVVSAKSDLAHIERTFSLGAVDFLTKPFDIDEYLGRIKLALNK